MARLGQLYDVQIQILIFYKQSGWAYSFTTTLPVYFTSSVISLMPDANAKLKLM